MSGLRHRNVAKDSGDSSSSSSIMEKVKRFDAYSKPMEDFRVQTTSGAFLTIVSSIIIAILIISEFLEYRSTTMVASMVVEKNRRDKMWIQMNITFPHVPCALIGVDVMDVAGEQQNDISHSMFKVRLDKEGNKISESKGEIGHAPVPNNTALSDPNYCGDCYGGVPKPTEENPKGCCNTCDDVREAYQRKGWSFNKPEEVEQCTREGYVDKVKQQAGEGCNIHGHVEVNRVAGNMHFAPGKSFQQAHMHVHDIHSFVQNQQGSEGAKADFTHTINHLSFGKVSAFANPLDGTTKKTPDAAHMYQYFIKVVGTRFQYLNGTVVSTNQFSVTEHEKSTLAPDGRGHVGLPGIFFNFEISPMTVIYDETRKSFGSFLTGVCAVVGGIFTVASILDSLIWQADTQLKKQDLLTKSN